MIICCRSVFARFDLIYAFLPMKRIFSKHCRVVHMFSQGIIETRRKELIQNKPKSEIKKYLDFIDVLLAAKVHKSIVSMSCI